MVAEDGSFALFFCYKGNETSKTRSSSQLRNDHDLASNSLKKK